MMRLLLCSSPGSESRLTSRSVLSGSSSVRSLVCYVTIVRESYTLVKQVMRYYWTNIWRYLYGYRTNLQDIRHTSTEDRLTIPRYLASQWEKRAIYGD